MKPHIFHVRDEGRVWYVVTDGVLSVTTSPRASEDDAREKWIRLVGRPAGGFVRIPGYVRPVEVAAQLLDDPKPQPARGGVA